MSPPGTLMDNVDVDIHGDETVAVCNSVQLWRVCTLRRLEESAAGQDQIGILVRGDTLRPHSINITRYTRYDHMTDWQWMEWGGFLCRTLVMLVCNLHIVIFLLCLYQHCLISWNSTTHLFIKHNQFVWYNHNIPELRILAYSTTHHLWFSFPLFPGPKGNL